MYLTTDTANAKIVGAPRRGFAAALTLPIKQTCPAACPMRDRGCYAQGGNLAIHVRRIENASARRTVLAIARDAAEEIETAARRGLAKGRPLRLFQAGDARTVMAARVLAKGARAWMRAGGTAAWGYTHAWRDVARADWQGVSMLASVESLSDAQRASARGYAPARVVAEHAPDGKAHDEGGITWIPCPEQTRGVPCVSCGLCFEADALWSRGAGIEFAAHGQRASAIKRRLPMLSAKGSS